MVALDIAIRGEASQAFQSGVGIGTLVIIAFHTLDASAPFRVIGALLILISLSSFASFCSDQYEKAKRSLAADTNVEAMP